nr:reverse transcriptase domain-containing protein [Tanacetum cinerariifolium]
MVAILEKSEHNVDFHPIVDFIEASPLRYALTVKPTVYVSHIGQFWSTGRIETTEEGTKILATVDGILRTISESSLRRNLKLQDEEGISSLPDTELFENLTLMGYNISPNQKVKAHAHHLSPITYPPLRQYTRRARIAQSLALPSVADEPASPLRDGSQREACPTDSNFGADQDRATIAKTSTLPHDSVPRVTYPTADEGSMQLKLDELRGLCTSLQRQHSEMVVKFEAHEMEINILKAKVKLLEDRDKVATERSGDDALIKGRSLDEGEAVAERVSDDTEEMAIVLTSIDAATVLASGAAEVPTGSGSIHTTGSPAAEVSTGSDVVPTASLISTTTTVVTPYRRRKAKVIMVESETPKKKKVQEQIDAQVARELEEQMAREDPRMSEQLEDFIPMGSKKEAERLKRKGLSLEQESLKKLKTSEEVPKEAKSPDEVPEEKVKEMMELVPIEEVYVEALQVKHHIIDWKVHTEGQRSYWKIIRLGVTSKDKEIFMLMEKDYPLRKGLAIVMICYKLQVENHSQMANDLILKIYKIANYLSQQGTSRRSKLRIEEFNLDKLSPPIVTMADQRTMAQLLQAPTEGYEDAIVIPAITADNFELKHGLLTLVQNKQFFGHAKKDLHAHVRYFNKITSTLKLLNVLNTEYEYFYLGISPDVAELKDIVKALLLDKKGQNQSLAPMKAVEESYVTCGGAHSYRNCPAIKGNVYRDNI